jgi:PAS domain S-box-containing protein
MKRKLKDKRNTVALGGDQINTILNNVTDGVFVVDKNYKIVVFNQMAAEISGFSTKRVIGKRYDKVLKFIHESDGKINDKFIKDAMATGETKEMSNHTVLIRKDGSKVAVADSAAPLKDKDGNVIGCVVVFRDVSKEHEVDKAKTEFVSLASHQLRTPLSAVNWYAEMLLAGDAGKISKEQKEYLEEIYNSNQRMVQLVNALLNVSRLELGTFTIEPELVNIAKIAEDVVKELMPEIDGKKIKFLQHYSRNLPKVNLDERLIKIILQNLLSNAVKYTPEKGKITLKILKKKDNIEIVVIDTGMGVPKSQQSKMFTKLFRADNVKETDTEGTGLGLYIIKSILDQCGGSVSFKSVEGKGTTFQVAIPLAGMQKKE